MKTWEYHAYFMFWQKFYMAVQVNEILELKSWRDKSRKINKHAYSMYWRKNDNIINREV